MSKAAAQRIIFPFLGITLFWACLVSCLGVAQGVSIVDSTPAPYELEVNPGQCVLAQRVTISNSSQTTPHTINGLHVFNVYPDAFAVSKIEAKVGNNIYFQATDKTLSQTTSTTLTGTLTINARQSIQMDIWVQVKLDPGSIGKRLQLRTQCNPEAVSARHITVVRRASNDDTLPGGYVHPGAAFCAQRLIVHNRRDDTDAIGIYSITVKNVAQNGNKLSGDQVAKVEIKLRKRDSGLDDVGFTTALTGFDDSGVIVYTSKNNTIPKQTEYVFEVWVVLKPVATREDLEKQVGKRVQLEATIQYTDGSYTEANITAAAVFQVERLSILDDRIAGATVYPGQRFLAQRLLVDNSRHGVPVVLNALNLSNGIKLPPLDKGLDGQYLAKIEILRSPDGVVLGQQTSPTELAKFGTTGVAVSLSAYNRVEAYSQYYIEVWITLRDTAPADFCLQCISKVVYTPGTPLSQQTEASATPAEAVFTVGKPEGVGAENLSVTAGNVYQGATFVAQKIKLTDNDGDPYDVTLTSVLVKNIATSPLADTQVAKIEIVRRSSDEVVIGEATSLAGLSSTGVRIPLTENNVLRDDTETTLEIRVTTKTDAIKDRKIQVRTVIWYTEGALSFHTSDLDGAIFTVKENKPPTGVNFSYSPSTGIKWNTEITFTPTASDPDGNIDKAKFEWDFGDGTKETKIGRVAVKHTYGKAGKFKVTLTVTDENGASAPPVTKEIEATNAPPTGVDFSFEPATGRWDIEITFTPSPNIKDPDGDLKKATFKWDFGDGKTETTTGPSPVKYAYRKGGEFSAKLTVTDEGGASASSEAKKIILTNEPPTGVDFSWTPQSPTWDDLVIFTPGPEAKDPDGDIKWAKFTWNFGDGTSTSITGPYPVSHRYGTGGNFRVQLIVTDEGGASAPPVIKELMVATKLPVDFYWTPVSPKAGELVTFTPMITEPEPPFTYLWDFGDGTTPSTEEKPKHTFTKAGTYSVRLEVTDKNGKKWPVAKTLSVGTGTPPTITEIRATPTTPMVGETVKFSAITTAPSADPAVRWEWDFGDGSEKITTTANEANHTFSAAGVYTVKVRAENIGGGWGEWKSMDIYVRPSGGALIGVKILDNPASQQCRIQILVPPTAKNVRISIFDLAGRLVLESSVSGSMFTWDLKNRNGQIVPNGLYLFFVSAEIEGKTERSEIGRILVRR